METKHHSSVIKWVVISLIGFIIALLIFKVGMIVGYTQATYSYGAGTSYYRTFVGKIPGIIDSIADDRQFLNDHGAFGQIIKIGTSTVVVHDPSDVEKIITIGSSTVIRKYKDTIQSSGLNVNDYVVVIGSPGQNGAIVAKLIRVVPPPPSLK